VQRHELKKIGDFAQVQFNLTFLYIIRQRQLELTEPGAVAGRVAGPVVARVGHAGVVFERDDGEQGQD
jgi:hypothetical protein